MFYIYIIFKVYITKRCNFRAFKKLFLCNFPHFPFTLFIILPCTLFFFNFCPNRHPDHPFPPPITTIVLEVFNIYTRYDKTFWTYLPRVGLGELHLGQDQQPSPSLTIVNSYSWPWYLYQIQKLKTCCARIKENGVSHIQVHTYFICIRHLILSESVTGRIFFSPKIPFYLHACTSQIDIYSSLD